MAEIYQICSGATPIDYSISIANQTTCDYYQGYWAGGTYITEWRQLWRVTSDKTLHSDLTVSYTYDRHTLIENLDPLYTIYEVTQQWPDTVQMYAGHTYVDFYVFCKKIWLTDTQRNTQEISNLSIAAQPSTPSCYVPPSCTLGISVITPTDPTARGDSDGTIYAEVTGATGTTVSWYLDGIIDVGTGLNHTFTGLVADTYYIKAVEADCWDQESVLIGEGEFQTGDFIVVSPTASGNIVAVENPVILQLSTAINSYTPAYSVNAFSVTGTISNVVIDFALSFPYFYEAEFRSKGYPDRSNYFLESVLTDKVGNPIGNNSTSEIATSLAEAFQKDAIISRLYYISNSGSCITLVAKEYGEDYDLDSSNVTITGSNLSLSNTTAGISQYDGQLIANYSLYAELFVDDNMQYGDTPVFTNYKRVLELELPFSNTNIHQFDLSSTLKNFVSSPLYTLIFTGATYLSEYIAGYFCKYGEKFPLVENSNTKKKRYKGTIDYGYCCNAALNFEDPNDMGDYFGTSGIDFINTAPNTKYSHRNGIEILYFSVTKDYVNPLAVFGNVYMYSGAEYHDIKFFDITVSGSTVNYGGIAAISVGYDALGLSSYEVGGEKIRKVDIQVYQEIGGVTGTTYTDLKSYLFEIDEQPDTFNVAFLNKLGTYESYSFYGELQENEEIERTTYQRPYSVASNGAASPGFQYNTIFNTEFTKTFVVNSGIIDEDNYYYLMGLLQSNKIFHYDIDHQNYLMVLSQTAMKSTNTNEYSLQIIFRETVQENNITS